MTYESISVATGAEAQYAILFDAMPGNVYLLKADAPRFTIIASSPKMLQLSGSKKEDVVGKGIFDLFPSNPHDPNDTGETNLRASLLYVLMHKGSHQLPTIRYDLTNDKGEFIERYWRAENSPVLSTDGQVAYIIHSSEDITEQVKAGELKERMKGMEQAYNLFMQAPNPICILKGPQLIIELANEPTLQLWGRSKEVIGLPLAEAIPEVRGQGYLEMFHEVRETGLANQVYESPVTIWRHGKEEVAYVNFVYEPFYEAGQKEAIGVLAIGNDVTDKVQAKKEAAVSEDRFQNLIRDAKVGIILLSGDEMKVEVVNESYAKLIGRTTKELFGQKLFDVIPEAETTFRPVIDGVRLSGDPLFLYATPYTVQVHGKEIQGYLDLVYQPYREADGHISGVMVLCQDVTEQIQFRKKVEEANQELQFVTDTMPQLVWATEANGHSYFFNKRWLEYTGLTLDEIVGDGWMQSLHPDDLERTTDAWTHAFQNGASYEIEYRLRRYDGTYRWFLTRGTPMKDTHGQILKWYGTTTDVHEQKRGAQALQQSNERFHLVVKATQDAIWDWNLLTNEIWWNEGFRELFKYEEEEIEPTIDSWYNRVHPDDKDRAIGSIHEVIDNGGKNWSAEYRFRRKDGSYAIVFDRGYALHDNSGTPYRMIGSMQDITERKKAQGILEHQNALISTIAHNATAALFMMDENGYCTFINKTGEQLFGYTFDELREKPMHDMIHHHRPDGSFYPREECPLENALHNKRPIQTYKELFFRKDGSTFLAACSASPIIEKGFPTSAVIEVRDISLEVEAEETLRRNAQQLEAMVQERTQELKQSNEQLKQFSYAASHDLQEPLRKISFFVDKLLNNLGPAFTDDSKKIAERIHHTTDRMRNLIDDLLNYSNTSLGTTGFEDVDLAPIVHGVLDDMDATIIEKGGEVKVETLPTVHGDQRQLRQLFQNLISNALKYHKRDWPPRVSITSKRVRGADADILLVEERKGELFHLIEVSDNGIGFDPDDAERIFRLFQRLHGKAEYEGTGVGLAIVQKVVENHNGYIWAESQPGEGATFKILLPIEPTHQ